MDKQEGHQVGGAQAEQAWVSGQELRHRGQRASWDHLPEAPSPDEGHRELFWLSTSEE